MKEAIIKFESVTKSFSLQSQKTFKEFFHALIVGENTTNNFTALNNISFTINRGETVGIIGRNGSGKSTLLQLICGTSSPTHGVVQVNGRVAALLELGSGFNPEFTGRENVFLNASLLGMSEVEIKTRLDEIINFADIGDFIDQPVKTYSSGMMVRLAFSVQIQLRPDILIIDEALSVGDFFFQQKCFARINEMRKDGLTLLFVSHDTGTVRDLCSSSVYLQKGVMKFFGDTQMAIQAYLSENQGGIKKDRTPLLPQIETKAIDIDDFLGKSIWRASDPQSRNPNAILGVAILDKLNKPCINFKIGEAATVVIAYVDDPMYETQAAVTVLNRFNQIVTVAGSYFSGISLSKDLSQNKEIPKIVFCEIEMAIVLEAGQYSLNISVGNISSPNKGEIKSRVDNVGPITISWDYDNEVAPFLGQFGLPSQCRCYYID